MAQKSVCMVLGWELKKSQAESWAVAAWGISLSGLGFTEWIRSGNLMASWMKKTGMLFPTISARVSRPLSGQVSRHYQAYQSSPRPCNCTPSVSPYQ